MRSLRAPKAPKQGPVVDGYARARLAPSDLPVPVEDVYADFAHHCFVNSMDRPSRRYTTGRIAGTICRTPRTTTEPEVVNRWSDQLEAVVPVGTEVFDRVQIQK